MLQSPLLYGYFKMSNYLVTPNMNLIAPNPANANNPEPGPQYALDQNQTFFIIDSHNHGPGSGVQITPTGLNISTNLNFQNNSPYNVYSVVFSAPAPTSNLTTLYTNTQSGGGIIDLFFNDGAGNVIALTKAGLVNATIASLPGESYSGGTFTWVQGDGSTTPANFDIGSITIRPNVAATTFGVVLGPPSAISSQYNIQLPTLPVTTSYVTIDSSGNMGIDNTASLIAAGSIVGTQIANQTITQNLLAPRATGSTVPIGGYATSSSSGSFSTTSISPTVIPGLSVTLTTTGRPVMVGLIHDGTDALFTNSEVIVSGSGGAALAYVYFFNATTATAISQSQYGRGDVGTFSVPSSSFWIIDTPIAGTYTYNAQLAVQSSFATSTILNTIIFAYEI